MKAAILAGGAGSRLYPITNYVPKPLIPIAGKPFLDYVITYLKKHGLTDLVFLLSDSEKELFKNYYGDGGKHGVRIYYSVSRRHGTASAIHTARRYLKETFLVYYGDVLTDLNLSDMIRFHKENNAICTVALSVGDPIEYGVGRIDENYRLTYFKEKPVLKEYPISVGVYLMEPEVLQYAGRARDVAADLIPQLLRKKVRVYGYVTDRPHYDIGTFKNLEVAKEIIQKKLGKKI